MRSTLPILISIVAACAGPATVAPTPEPSSPKPTPIAAPSATPSAVPSPSASASSSASAVASAEPPATAPDLAIAPWSPKGAVGAELHENKPFAALGATLLLTRFGHKQMVKGPVVGIWEWELQKGGAKVAGSYTGQILFGELSTSGVLAVIESNNGPIRGTLVPWKEKPFTEDEAADFAEKEHARRNLPKTKKGRGYSVEAGVMRLSWMGDPRVDMQIGMHSKRVLSIAIKKATKSSKDDDD